MRKHSSKRGSSSVEYVVIGITVGIIGGYSFLLINPDTFKKTFMSSIGSSSTSGHTITIRPIGETTSNTPYNTAECGLACQKSTMMSSST